MNQMARAPEAAFCQDIGLAVAAEIAFHGQGVEDTILKTLPPTRSVM